MNYVEPIRDPDVVKNICMYLKETNSRNFIMFYIGIYSGLRISDILKLKVADVKNKNSINIREKKTRKQKIYTINPSLKKEIKIYCEGKPLSEYLIKSRESENKPITRERAYQIMKELGDIFGIPDVGTHTLRKTFGYHHYMQYKDVVMLQKIFNHASPAITLKYIGYEQENINKSIKNFKIF
ncbi:MAG TPA: site-specific integrase [Thermoclostridium sp.]|nr:site-specific integrase [Thermoclostridium sp.]